jgi:glutathione S-transferase
MKIYDAALGPFPARVRIAIAEKNLTSRIEFVPIDLLNGEHKTAAFREKNYSGTVPVLELEDGTLISECVAITRYLDVLEGTPTLTGTTPKEQGLIHMMTKRAEMEFIEAISIYFHHATPGLGAQVEKYQNQAWGIYQRDKALAGMRYFDSILRDHPFVAGEFFSMADMAVIGGLIFVDHLDVEVPADCDALSSWYAAMQERPSVKHRVTMSE